MEYYASGTAFRVEKDSNNQKYYLYGTLDETNTLDEPANGVKKSARRLQLDKVLANKNGTLTWDTEGSFSETTTSAELTKDNRSLLATVKTGKTINNQPETLDKTVDLSTHIKNHNGRFRFNADN